jgi:hypothetical protein
MTLEQAQAQLDAWLAASLALAGGKEHEVAGRRIRFEDGAEVREQIAFWQRQVGALSAAATGATYGSARYVVADFSDPGVR